jgi:hypothetical protein
VDIPEKHVQRGLTPPARDDRSAERPLLHVHSGDSPPDDVFIAVPYEDAWFWIENSDWESKRAIVAIMFLFTLSDTGEPEKLPMITIPAQ